MEIRNLIARLGRNSPALLDLSPREFEEVVAELLASFGWQVRLTPASRDGGYDMLAITSDQSSLETSWIIECKRYAEGRKVGVELARTLLGVKTHLGIPNAVLVSTSGFTAGATEFSEAQNDVHLVGPDTLSTWLEAYGASPTGKDYTATHSFSSCFLSHSHEDEEFAHKLAAKLRREGIRVWFAPEDIRPGEKIHDQIKKAIATFDKLILVLSASSMQSNWVKTEILAALKREGIENTQVLFPVALVPIEEVRKWECLDPDSGIDVAREIRSYFIPDFSTWQDPECFEKRASSVVKALRVSVGSSPSAVGRLDPAEEQILRYIAEENQPLYGHIIAAAIEVPEAKAQYFLNRLVERRYVVEHLAIGGTALYSLDDDGGAYLVENGLI